MKKSFLAIALLSGLGITNSAFANSLSNMHVNFLSDNSNSVKFEFSDKVVKPVAIDSKNNVIHLKFEDLQSALKNDYFNINESGIRNIKFENTGKDLNVYISLDQLKRFNSYETNNSFTLDLENKSISNIEYDKLINAKQDILIDSVNFERDNDNQSEIVISHNSNNPIYDVVEFNGGIELTFDNASMPSKLFKNVDVSEYSTPIDSYLTRIEDGHAVVKVFYKKNFNANYVITKVDNKIVIVVKGNESTTLRTSSDGTIKSKNKSHFEGERIDFDFQDIPVKNALFLIAQKMGLNLVMADNIDGRLTLLLKDVPYDQALDIILRTKGLGKHIEGNIMLVAPLEEIMQREEFELTSKNKIDDIKPLKTDTVQIKYAKSADVFALLDKIKSDRGNIIFDARTNKMFLEDTASKLFEMKNLIEKIDIPVRQVSVEARIVYAKKSVGDSLGVKWRSGVNPKGGSLVTEKNAEKGEDVTHEQINGSNLAVGVGSALGSLGGAANTAAITLGFINANVDVTLNALEKTGDVDIISKPLIISADKKTSKISSGKEFPYREISENGDVTTSFKEIKLSLEVTPQITPDNKLIMDLSVIQDSIAELTDAGPALDSTDINTQVIVNDKETLVLGGVFKNEEVNGVEKVPFLGDLPIIGNAFKYKEKNNEKMELLIFITPKILNGDEVITK